MNKHLSILLLGCSLVGVMSFGMHRKPSQIKALKHKTHFDDDIVPGTFELYAFADWQQKNESVREDDMRLLENPTYALKKAKKKEKNDARSVSKEIQERYGRSYDYVEVQKDLFNYALSATHTSISDSPSFEVLSPVNSILYKKQLVRVVGNGAVECYRGDCLADLEELYGRTKSPHQKAHFSSMIEGMRGYKLTEKDAVEQRKHH